MNRFAHRNLIAFALFASATSALTATGAHAKIKIVATLPSLGAIARDVGGDDVEVEVLAAPTEDPHFVDPKPSLILKLNQADMLIMNGLGLEIGWLPKLQVQARNPKIAPGGANVLDASTIVDKLDVAAAVDRSMGDIHPGGNPHFLFDARQAQKVSRAISDKLAQLDASIAERVQKRAADEAAKLDAIDAAVRARVDVLAPEKRRVVAYHRSLVYLEDWLKLEEVATIEPKPGVPPDPGHVANVLTKMKQTGTKVVLQEEFYPRTTAKTLSELAGAKLVVLPGGARFQQGESYPDHLKKITDEVLHALGG